MTKQAMEDAFIAGWNGGRTGPTRLAVDAFNEWYQRSIETLDRSPVPACADKAHDYQIDKSDGRLICTICKEVLF